MPRSVSSGEMVTFLQFLELGDGCHIFETILRVTLMRAAPRVYAQTFDVLEVPLARLASLVSVSFSEKKPPDPL